jgi:hypothetical protein
MVTTEITVNIKYTGTANLFGKRMRGEAPIYVQLLAIQLVKMTSRILHIYSGSVSSKPERRKCYVLQCSLPENKRKFVLPPIRRPTTFPPVAFTDAFYS